MRSTLMKSSLKRFAVSKSAFSYMASEAENKFCLETGGVLLGTVNDDRIVVQIAVGPGPAAKHGFASFVRDGAYAQLELERVLSESNGEIDYLGEWHTHTIPVGPSTRDKKSMAVIALNSQYGISNPFLILCMPKRLIGQREWTIRAFQWTKSGLVQQGVEFL